MSIVNICLVEEYENLSLNKSYSIALSWTLEDV